MIIIIVIIIIIIIIIILTQITNPLMHGTRHQIEQNAKRAKYNPQKIETGTARTAVKILNFCGQPETGKPANSLPICPVFDDGIGFE